MKITRIECLIVANEHPLVRIETEDRLVGWGECFRRARDIVQPAIERYLGPALLGANALDTEGLHRRLMAMCQVAGPAGTLAVAAGESHYTARAFQALIVEGRIDVLQPDVVKAAGLTELQKIAVLAHVHGEPMTVHNTQPTLCTAAHLHFCAVHPHVPYEQEYNIEPVSIRDEWPILPGQLTVEAGHIAVPDGPGLGVEVDEALVRRLVAETDAGPRSLIPAGRRARSAPRGGRSPPSGRRVHLESHRKVLFGREGCFCGRDACGLALRDIRHGGEENRRSDLGNDHASPNPTHSDAACSSARLTETDFHVRSRDFQRRNDAGDDRREDSEPGRICQGRRGEPAFEPERPAFLRGTHRRQCPLQREIRCGQAEHRRNGGEHERFGEQLHHDPAPGGTEGPPHENLPLTGRGSGKHQQRDVAADHHEEQRAEGVD